MGTKHGDEEETSSTAAEDASSADVGSLPEEMGPEHKLLTPEDAAGDDGQQRGRPLVIFFHGSGESCESWEALARTLTSDPYRLRVLMYNRGPLRPKPPQATEELRGYLRAEGLAGPYVLVAHSYGGAFARMFLEEEEEEEGEEGGDAAAEGYAGKDVVGVVLVETGQEGGLDAKVEERQYERRVLGRRPLSVVSGNSLLRMWRELDKAEATVDVADTLKREDLKKRKEMLEVWEKADEEMKRKQLDLVSRRGTKRYVHVPDVGHDVERDRPDVVAREVAWVIENMAGDGGEESEGEEEGADEQRLCQEGRDRGWKGVGKGLWEVYKKMFGRFFFKAKK
ncbi:Alpha/Beta hydrolase protein [Jackrogersella minutella]|nr:Alpha/Beta hydrolase protein [Jackrogersella minutella]